MVRVCWLAVALSRLDSSAGLLTTSKANVKLNLQMLDLAWIWIDALTVKQLKNLTMLLKFKPICLLMANKTIM